jgi:glutaredoxin
MVMVLYGKPNCSLCEELKTDLVAMQAKIGFALEERNIEEDAALYDRFRYLIPVLEVDGGELLYPPHDLSALYHTLRAAAMSRP